MSSNTDFGKVAICTIIAKNYLPFARSLMQSVKQWQPDYQRYVLFIDTPDGYFDPAEEDFESVFYSELAIPASAIMPLKYDITEFATAVKPYLLELLFKKHHLQKLYYFDPDIFLFNKITPLTERLDSASIVLTPHLTGLLDDDRKPSELEIMMAGVYNLGFIGLSATPETYRFLDWWKQKLLNDCVIDFEHNKFVDQRWIDLVPGLFDGVSIIRDPGYNLAYWNLKHRPLEWKAGQFYVKGNLLRFYHFSGYNPNRPDILSKHETRFTDTKGYPALHRVLAVYRHRLLANGYNECRKWPYSYAQLFGGVQLPDISRKVFVKDPTLYRGPADPFSQEGTAAVLAYLNQPVVSDSTNPDVLAITELVKQVYDFRVDLQAAFPDPLGKDSRRLAEWFVENGAKEHNLSPTFVNPVARALGKVALEVSPVETPSTEPEDTDIVAGSALIPASNTSSTSKFLPLGNGHKLLLDWFNEGVDSKHAEPPVTILAYFIHQSRADLQEAFPEPLGKDREVFAAWFVASAIREYKLHPVFVEPVQKALGQSTADFSVLDTSIFEPLLMKELLLWVAEELDWDALLEEAEATTNGESADSSSIEFKSSSSFSSKSANTLKLSRLAYRVYQVRPDLQKVFPNLSNQQLSAYIKWFFEHGAAEYQFDNFLLDDLRRAYQEWLDDSRPSQRLWQSLNTGLPWPTRTKNTNVFQADQQTLQNNQFYFRVDASTKLKIFQHNAHKVRNINPERFGLNVVGYLNSSRGLAEAARQSIRAARQVGIPVRAVSLSLPDDAPNSNWSELLADQSPTMPITLNHINADQVKKDLPKLSPRFAQNCYNIGYWYWETNEFPDEWKDRFDYFDEVWVATEFVRSTVAAAAPANFPVLVRRPSIDVVAPAGVKRSYFGLPEDKFIYLNIFDYNSIVERKNPFGLIEAFRQAYTDKNNSLAGKAHLALKVRGVSENSYFVQKLYQAAEGLPLTVIANDMSASHVCALILGSDCMISLHRSEGFGQTLAQAMLLKRPVIATNYSGNVDFTLSDNAYLVDYQLKQLDRDYFPYKKGSWWADPDLDQAARHFQKVYFDHIEREQKVARAYRFMLDNYSLTASGLSYKNRLNEIYATLSKHSQLR